MELKRSKTKRQKLSLQPARLTGTLDPRTQETEEGRSRPGWCTSQILSQSGLHTQTPSSKQS